MSINNILITGAAQGIGHASALALAARGATLILLDKDVQGLEQLYDAIEAAGGPEPALYPMDLAGATPVDYDELAERIVDQVGQLSGLLHNAAMLGVMSRIEDYDPQTWYKVMQTNLHAPMLLTQALLPVLCPCVTAQVLFCSDTVGRRPKAYWGAYAASKAGLEALMAVLADELEQRPIQINSFDPGPTRTQLRNQSFPAEIHEQLQSPEVVAERICRIMLEPHDWHGVQLDMATL
jgi:NAD(P)-dependent dehydrogenase (short-subunit alcohol dehydrogenase family)